MKVGDRVRFISTKYDSLSEKYSGVEGIITKIHNRMIHTEMELEKRLAKHGIVFQKS